MPTKQSTTMDTKAPGDHNDPTGGDIMDFFTATDEQPWTTVTSKKKQRKDDKGRKEIHYSRVPPSTMA